MKIDLFIGSDIREDVLSVLKDEEEEEDDSEYNRAKQRDYERPLVFEEVSERFPESCDRWWNKQSEIWRKTEGGGKEKRWSEWKNKREE